MAKRIQITKPDMHRLEELVERWAPHGIAGAEALENELDEATVVDPETISNKVVTMNSRARILDLDRGSESVVTIVFPVEANAQYNRISVLAPLGTALLGCRVGETVRFNAPGGQRRVKILNIEYQPEAAARQRGGKPSEGVPVGSS